MRPPGGSVRPEGATPPGQWKAGPPEVSTGSPMMQSSAVVLYSSRPCTVGWKSGVGPKSTVGPGCSVSVQGGSCRPSAASGTSIAGCRPSFESIRSIACDMPSRVGRKEKRTVALAPGSPTSRGEGVCTVHAGSDEITERLLTRSGVTRCGSRPTLLICRLPERVVPIAVAPTKTLFGVTCTTAPMPMPCSASTAGAPSETAMVASAS